MIYKIVMMSGNEIALQGEEEVQNFMKQVAKGNTLIMTKFGIVNISSVDCIVPHKEKNHAVMELMRYSDFDEKGNQKPKYTLEQAETHECGRSPFEKLVADGKKKLAENMSFTPQLRTAAQEEAAADERRS